MSKGNGKQPSEFQHLPCCQLKIRDNKEFSLFCESLHWAPVIIEARLLVYNSIKVDHSTKMGTFQKKLMGQRTCKGHSSKIKQPTISNFPLTRSACVCPLCLCRDPKGKSWTSCWQVGDLKLWKPKKCTRWCV